MTTVESNGLQRNPPVKLWLAPILLALTLGGCPSTSTEFIYEGPGQPSDRASGVVPDGANGACKRPKSKRPPIVSERLWQDARECGPKTPFRFIRMGYGNVDDPPDAEPDRRMKAMMDTLKASERDVDGNTKMLRMLRSVQQEAKGDVNLQARLQRASGRSFSCDYAYMLNTTSKELAKLAGTSCAATAYDTKVRGDQCLFDDKLPEAVWLTSPWGCVAHTGAAGEAQSCYRLCAYDDHCAAQVNCAAPDFDLLLCALGVCLPEATEGLR
jgi:hypothetical protein